MPFLKDMYAAHHATGLEVITYSHQLSGDGATDLIMDRDPLLTGGALLVPPADENPRGPIECTERLGGLLRFYRRQAA